MLPGDPRRICRPRRVRHRYSGATPCRRRFQQLGAAGVAFWPILNLPVFDRGNWPPRPDISLSAYLRPARSRLERRLPRSWHRHRQVRDIPAETTLAVHKFAEIGIILLLFLIGLEIQLDQLRRLGRDVLAFGVPQIILTALLIGLYAWWGFAEWEASLVLGPALLSRRQWSWSNCSRSAMNCTRPGVARRLRSSWLKTSPSFHCYWWSHSWPSGKVPVLPAGPGCGR